MAAWVKGVVFAVAMVGFVSSSFGITTRVNRQASASDFATGKTDKTVISSQGAVSLGPEYAVIADKLEQAWTVNAVIAANGAVYAGTSPNGCIYKYSDGEVKKIYPVEPMQTVDLSIVEEANAVKDVNATKDANSIIAEKKEGRKTEEAQHLTNEHVFAFGLDSSGRVLAAVSGKNCRLLRFEGDKAEVIFEPNDASYIFAIATDDFGAIYLGTGPNGKIYKLDPSGKDPQCVYTATDKNILSLIVGIDGFVYAGSDGRGIVYRIDAVTKTATVLYDSPQSDITALAFDGKGDLYATATTPSLSKADAVPLQDMPGRPEMKQGNGQRPNQPVPQVEAVNTERKLTEEDKERIKVVVARNVGSSMPSHIYRITQQGFVTDMFQDNVIFLGMVAKGDSLLIGTGNKGQLYSYDIGSEEKEVVYKDEQATQVSAVFGADGNTVYVGLSNPAKIVKLSTSPATSGSYTSDLIDADQPAKWGKFQLQASIPQGTSIQVSARTSNVGDVNDAAFSEWSKPVDYNQPMSLDIPTGRFLQYKLVLTGSGEQTPVVREVVVPFVVANLPPKVQTVLMVRPEDKPGMFNIGYKTIDRNGDKLIYRLDIRKVGREGWIKIKDELETDVYLWDSRTLEDGRYEIKVTASDSRSNPTESAMSDSRLSDPFVVDNSAPIVASANFETNGNAVTVDATVEDNLSTFAAVSYTVDSGSNWTAVMPNDGVFDTTKEDIKIKLSDLAVGRHVLAVKMTDTAGNTGYKTFDFEIK